MQSINSDLVLGVVHQLRYVAYTLSRRRPECVRPKLRTQPNVEYALSPAVRNFWHVGPHSSYGRILPVVRTPTERTKIGQEASPTYLKLRTAKDSKYQR